MKKFLLMLAIMGSVVTTASAEKKEQPKEEYVYTFRGHCETLSITKVFDHELSDAEYAYYQGFYDAQCDKNLHYC